MTELQVLIEARMKEMFPDMLNNGKDGEKRPAETDNDMGTSTKLVKTHMQDELPPPSNNVQG